MSARGATVIPLRPPADPPPARPSPRAVVFLLIPVATLLIIGLGAIMSATSVLALRQTGDHLYYFKRQVVFAVIGVALLAVAARVPYRLYRRLAVPILLFALAGLVVVLVAGDVRGGARRWIEIGGHTVQPSEFAKFAVIVFLAAAMSRKEAVLHRFTHFVLPVAASVGLAGLLVMLQPDLGTTLLIAAGAMAVLMASATPLRYVALSGVLGVAAALALARTSSYRWARITAFLDPTGDPLGAGFQATQSLVAIGTGGWFGIGLGASRARWSFLPNAHTDFIFAIIGEETGFTGALIVLLLFAVFAAAGTVVALRAPDPFGRMLGIGIVAWLSAQAIVNVGGVTALLPITGVPLPFVSFGGTALLVNLAAVGVLLNIARAEPA